MRACDFKMPWGRAAEDEVTKRRERLGHLHMTKRLESVGKVVDTNAPRSMGGIGYDRRKKQQLVVARQRIIDFENKKLVDSMAGIMRGEGPPVHPYRPYIKGSSKTAVQRKMIRIRIDLENQFIADRLRNRIVPVVNHLDHARDYAKNTRIRKNISTACKREVRTKQFQAAKSRKAAMMRHLSSSASLSPERVRELQDFDRSQMSTSMSSLRTASEVRRFLAEERGIVIPEGIISSRTKAAQKTSNKERKYAIQLRHQGAPPASVPLDIEAQTPSGTSLSGTGAVGTLDIGQHQLGTLAGLNESAIELSQGSNTNDHHHQPFLPDIQPSPLAN